MSRRILVTPTSRRRKKTVHGLSNGSPMDKVEIIPEREDLPLLQCRCLLSNFTRRIGKWQLDGREWELLKTTPFGNLMEGILKVDMNMEILDALLGFWDEENCGFVIGGTIIPFTADDIALITGLPNRGCKVVRQKVTKGCNDEFSRIHTNVSQIERRLDKILQSSRNSPSGETDRCFVQQMILYLWVAVLFPSSSRIVPQYLSYYVKNLESIGSYNWAETTHSFLVKEINIKSKLLKQKNEGKKVAVRYMNGLCFAINVWFFEHVNFGEESRPSNPDVRPRMLKWVSVCKSWQRKPFLQRLGEIVNDKVSCHILPTNDELELLSMKNVEYMTSKIVGGSDDAMACDSSQQGILETLGSDINHVYEGTDLKGREVEEGKKAGNDDYSEIKLLREVIREQNERISVLEKKFVKLEKVALSKGWEIEERMIDTDDLCEHKDGEVEEEAHDGDNGLAAERIDQPNLVEINVKQQCRLRGKRKVLKLPIAKEHLVIKRRMNVEKMQSSIHTMGSSPRFWRKDNDILVNLDDYACPIKQKKDMKIAPLNYVGRELLTEDERKYLDAFCVKPMQRDDVVFYDWNVAIRRHSMVEFLQGGYTGEEIIDAYVRLLCKGDKMSGNDFASFLYVPPMFLGLYRNRLGSYKTFLDSVDKESLEKVKFLFLPCLIQTANHWLLLVCDMEMQKWSLYDSLYDPRHRGAAKKQVMLFAEYLYQDHRFDIRTWNLEYKRIYPQQEPGTLDCGIFVMKFIENIIRVPRTISFRGTDMLLFRPQIAYRILCQC